MNYDPKIKALTLKTSDLDAVYLNLMYTLKQLRELAGLPLNSYKRDGLLDTHDFAAMAVVEAGMSLGIDFGIANAHQHNLINHAEPELLEGES